MLIHRSRALPVVASLDDAWISAVCICADCFPCRLFEENHGGPYQRHSGSCFFQVFCTRSRCTSNYVHAYPVYSVTSDEQPTSALNIASGSRILYLSSNSLGITTIYFSISSHPLNQGKYLPYKVAVHCGRLGLMTRHGLASTSGFCHATRSRRFSGCYRSLCHQSHLDLVCYWARLGEPRQPHMSKIYP
jgi:hypothetical protein